MSQKLPPKPAWYKNTYFWISAALLLLGLLALVKGPEAIRDPGQKREGGIALWYLFASVLMLVNGWISHHQTVKAYDELVESTPEVKETPAATQQAS